MILKKLYIFSQLSNNYKAFYTYFTQITHYVYQCQLKKLSYLLIHKLINDLHYAHQSAILEYLQLFLHNLIAALFVSLNPLIPLKYADKII